MTGVIGAGQPTGYPAAMPQGGFMSTSIAPPVVDIRQLGPCVERKACVLAAFDALERGQSLIVVNDHLPRGLRTHFEEHRQGMFAWRPLEEGPHVFRVEIERI
jgi:uncharacterized protein (DUF2249 family)